MKKKNIFFPILGCLSGVGGVVSGFVLSCSVKDTVSALTKKVAIDSADQNFDFYSYFFGNTQSASVDDTALMIAKLIELCGKGFGLMLIFIGLFTVCYFGYKIERMLNAPDFPPAFIPQNPDFSYGAPVEEPVADEGIYEPSQGYIAPDEGIYPPAGEYSASADGEFSSENTNPQ